MIQRPKPACEIGLAIAARRRSRHREEPCLQDMARVLRRCPSYACPCRSSCSPLAAHRLNAAEAAVRLLPAAEGAAASSAARTLSRLHLLAVAVLEFTLLVRLRRLLARGWRRGQRLLLRRRWRGAAAEWAAIPRRAESPRRSLSWASACHPSSPSAPLLDGRSGRRRWRSNLFRRRRWWRRCGLLSRSWRRRSGRRLSSAGGGGGGAASSAGAGGGGGAVSSAGGAAVVLLPRPAGAVAAERLPQPAEAAPLLQREEAVVAAADSGVARARLTILWGLAAEGPV